MGFSEGEIHVYAALIEIGISNLQSIQEKTGIDRRNIYDILNKLIEKGLVSYTVESGKKTFQITHPNKLLGYLKEKKKSLEEQELLVKKELPELMNKFNAKKHIVHAEVFRGNEAIKALMEEMLEHKAIYWMGGNSGIEKTSLKYWFQHWMESRIKKKIILYDLVDHGTFLQGLEPEKIEQHKKQLYKRCELPENLSSPLNIAVFGNKVAQILWSDQSFAFVLESEDIKESFMKYFNYFWRP